MTEWITRDETNDPTEPGFYRVMIAGDSESIDGFTIYEYGDYPTWATWHAPEDDENQGHFTTEHDEGDGVFAYYGPINIPEYK